MNHVVARQTITDDDDIDTGTDNPNSGPSSPAPDGTPGTDTPAADPSGGTGAVSDASDPETIATAATDPAAAPGVTDSNTEAVIFPDSTAPPATDSAAPSSGASDVPDPSSVSAQTTGIDTSTGPPVSQSDSGTQSSVIAQIETTTGLLSAVASESTALTSPASETSAFPSSTSSLPITTPEASSSTAPASSSQSSSEPTATNQSSSSSPITDASTSLTTSFAEIVSTINGEVTTIVTPLATLNAETSSTHTSSNRIAAIAGGTVAGLAATILCLLAIFLYRRRRKRRLDQSHRYLPTPRSVALAGEDNFDLAGSSQPRRGFGLFGNNGADEYRDLGSDSGRDVNSPVMHELPSEPPPRLLRPVASKTGSYFQEAVWPPPDEGSCLSDPLMAASNVDLHSIVDEVMGPQNQSVRSSVDTSIISSPPRPSRLRGGFTDSDSFFGESGTPLELVPRIPVSHGESPTMSSIDSTFESPQHARDWSTDSATGLLAGPDKGTIASRRRSGGSATGYGYGSTSAWLPSGAAPPSGQRRATSPLRIVSEPRPISLTSLSASSDRAKGKATEAAQERRSSLTIANPSPEEQGPELERELDEGASSPSVYSQSWTVTTSRSLTQRLQRPVDAHPSSDPNPDESPSEIRHRRSIRPPSLANTWLLDVEDDMPTPRPGDMQRARMREELPPRYDMIRRDSDEDVDLLSRTRSL